jgi:putative heme transporter
MPAASAIRSSRSADRNRIHAVRAYLQRHRRLITAGLGIAVVACFVWFVLPQIEGLSGTLHRLRDADPAWIILALGLEGASLGGYGLLFATVFSCHSVRLGAREAFEITLAGTVASKLLSTAGAGGVALTVWALRAAGLPAAAIARRMLAFELLLYGVFAATILCVGVGLRTGVLPGEAPWTLTVVPAIVGAVAITVTIGLTFVPRAPRAVREALGIALGLVREHTVGALGALAYWGFDIGALWASLHAFGAPPPFATVVMAYFVGQLGNTLPLPGGIGGVEGGMIGTLIAFGTPASLAILGVLAYRVISFWLPTIPGGVAYVRLRTRVAGWRAADAAASAPGNERDVPLPVRDGRTVRDVPDQTAAGVTADRIGARAALARDEQVSRADSGVTQRGGTDPEHDVVAGMAVSGGETIGEERAHGPARDKAGALDADVRPVGQAGDADQDGSAARGDRVDPPAPFIGGDEVPGEATEAAGSDGDPALDPRRARRDRRHPAMAVDGIDSRT